MEKVVSCQSADDHAMVKRNMKSSYVTMKTATALQFLHNPEQQLGN